MTVIYWIKLSIYLHIFLADKPFQSFKCGVIGTNIEGSSQLLELSGISEEDVDVVIAVTGAYYFIDRVPFGLIILEVCKAKPYGLGNFVKKKYLAGDEFGVFVLFN